MCKSGTGTIPTSFGYWLVCAREAYYIRSFLQFYIDSVVEKIKTTGVGCHYFSACVSVFLYADDILLIALQILLSACDEELTRLGKKVGMHAVWFTL